MFRRAFHIKSGTYHVRASELACIHRRKQQTMTIDVHFLDESMHSFSVRKNAKGYELFDQVAEHLDLVDREYFGLQFRKKTNKSIVYTWLDLHKHLKKQLSNTVEPKTLHFKVRFYAIDPSDLLLEEFTRYQFYLQIRQDIFNGRLTLPNSIACLLGSYIAQSEIGDYAENHVDQNYLSSLKILPNQDEDLERKIAELHKLHKGQTPADAECNFLEHAKRLDMYGVDLFPVKDSAMKPIQLGITAYGLVVFQNNIRINMFSWSKILKISYKRRQFYIQLKREKSEDYDTLLGFNLESYQLAKLLWKTCVEHHTFYRVPTPIVKNKQMPAILQKAKLFLFRDPDEKTVKSKQNRFERLFQRSHAVPKIKESAPNATVASPKKFSLITDEKSAGKRVLNSQHLVINLNNNCNGTKNVYSPAFSRIHHDNKITSVDTKEPKKAWSTEMSDDEGGFLNSAEDGAAFSPVLLGHSLSYADDDPLHSPVDESTSILCSSHSSMFNVQLKADPSGRFGFNVIGGKDSKQIITISRIAPNTPADNCEPKLSEGDRILFINGVDVRMGVSYERVIEMVRETVELNDRVLELVVEPKSEHDVDDDEPSYQYIPEKCDLITNGIDSNDALTQSMYLLANGSTSGVLATQFDLLYKRNPAMNFMVALEDDNIIKNRYRDILPYDETRVILRDNPGGDFINANHISIQLKIGEGNKLTNKYIATQGPLSSTSEDFWQMIFENNVHLIVMLTTIVEQGRTKCHKYWPSLDEVIQTFNLKVKCVEEEFDAAGNFICRTFVVSDLTMENNIRVQHMQYVTWPDHDVPDSSCAFLEFTQKIRKIRSEHEDSAVVVHCSAGIGRTGVLILMETAICLIEANEPVYPLDIVQQMREQRAMMIQNAVGTLLKDKRTFLLLKEITL